MTLHAPPIADAGADLVAFRALLGQGSVTDDLERRTLLSQDIWTLGETVADLVVSPETTQDLIDVLAEAAQRRLTVAIRGGGMSYTVGYSPQKERTVLLDLARFDKVIEVNADAMTVTVQAGCTWKTLNETLKAKGLRTPFWGPLSGISSTVGGGLSQLNAIFGAGQYGTTSESVIGLAVVLADGTVLRTGAQGRGRHPFYRHYGPDLTGLFCGDCGVFGVKAEITLRLMRIPAHEGCISFAFRDPALFLRATAEVTRSGITSEVVGFDPTLAEVRLKRASILSGVKAMGAVATGGKTLLAGVGDAVKIALAGRGFLGAEDYSLHLAVEGRSKIGVEEDLAELRRIVLGIGGKETENSIPKILRAQPFTPLNNILGPDGERWVPVHGIVAVSDAEACFADLEAMFATHRAEMQSAGVSTGFMFTTLSTNAFLIEPVFFWPEARMAIHDATIEAGMLSKLKVHEPNPEATALVAKVRKAVVDVFQAYGAAHFQIGRTYPWLASRDVPSARLAQLIKAALDPDDRLNPGGLGL